MPPGPNAALCYGCGRSFLDVWTRSLHEFDEHARDNYRPELGESPSDPALMREALLEAEKEAAKQR